MNDTDDHADAIATLDISPLLELAKNKCQFVQSSSPAPKLTPLKRSLSESEVRNSTPEKAPVGSTALGDGLRFSPYFASQKKSRTRLQGEEMNCDKSEANIESEESQRAKREPWPTAELFFTKLACDDLAMNDKDNDIWSQLAAASETSNDRVDFENLDRSYFEDPDKDDNGLDDHNNSANRQQVATRLWLEGSKVDGANENYNDNVEIEKEYAWDLDKEELMNGEEANRADTKKGINTESSRNDIEDITNSNVSLSSMSASSEGQTTSTHSQEATCLEMMKAKRSAILEKRPISEENTQEQEQEQKGGIGGLTMRQKRAAVLQNWHHIASSSSPLKMLSDIAINEACISNFSTSLEQNNVEGEEDPLNNHDQQMQKEHAQQKYGGEAYNDDDEKSKPTSGAHESEFVATAYDEDHNGESSCGDEENNDPLTSESYESDNSTAGSDTDLDETEVEDDFIDVSNTNINGEGLEHGRPDEYNMQKKTTPSAEDETYLSQENSSFQEEYISTSSPPTAADNRGFLYQYINCTVS